MIRVPLYSRQQIHASNVFHLIQLWPLALLREDGADRGHGTEFLELPLPSPLALTHPSHNRSINVFRDEATMTVVNTTTKAQYDTQQETRSRPHFGTTGIGTHFFRNLSQKQPYRAEPEQEDRTGNSTRTNCVHCVLCGGKFN